MGYILAIDYGKKRIGTAIADEELKIATPLKLINVNNFTEAVQVITSIVLEYKVEKVIIGHPLNVEGESTDISEEVDKFIKQFPDNIEFVKINEFLSSKAAEESLRKLKYKVRSLDTEVARLFLQEYLQNN